ncbi:MAG TPA: plastocyanin/azurin family copper-binding protein [Solirubrobacteraceae bacterium]|jgi:plastocyanin|nr:plastocyanin/azurin family copper-binding protein [Solirubrobacteraceae bacterium]
MGIRGLVGYGISALLGAAFVVLPATAGSETTPPAVVAQNVGLYTHYWTPPSVSVEPGGTVEFSNPTEVPHGVHWVGTPAGDPECTSGVPVGTTETASGTKWTGTCKFATAGTYTYYCTVHGASMSGKITVGTPSSTPTPTPPTSPTTGPTGTTSAPITGAGDGTGTSPAAAAISALKLGGVGHGGALHGSLQVSQTAAGGTLTIVLQARLGGHRVQVGRLRRSQVSAGSQSWTITLSARARHALHAKGRLALTAKVLLTPPTGADVSLTRTLTLHG